jgi:uncharacterized protein (DUF3084 family)
MEDGSGEEHLFAPEARGRGTYPDAARHKAYKEIEELATSYQRALQDKTSEIRRLDEALSGALAQILSPKATAAKKKSLDALAASLDSREQELNRRRSALRKAEKELARKDISPPLAMLKAWAAKEYPGWDIEVKQLDHTATREDVTLAFAVEAHLKVRVA